MAAHILESPADIIATFSTSDTFDESVPVTVTNVGPVPLTFKYARRKFVFAAGESKMVPWLAMCLWFGDPRAVDRHPTKRSLQFRRQERDRLVVKYGLGTKPLYSDDHETVDNFRDPSGRDYLIVDDPIHPHNGQRRHPNLPAVRVFDVQTGNRVITVMDDPEAVTITGDQTARVEARDTEAQIQRLTAMVQELQTNLADLNPEAAERLRTQLDPEGAGQLDPLAATMVDEAVPAPSADPDLSEPDPLDPDFETPASTDTSARRKRTRRTTSTTATPVDE
jgi:hypothetical protein